MNNLACGAEEPGQVIALGYSHHDGGATVAAVVHCVFLFGAERGNRTHTPFPEPDFESGASTSSAIPAAKGLKYT